jgi:hypothetical protein
VERTNENILNTGTEEEEITIDDGFGGGGGIFDDFFGEYKNEIAGSIGKVT